MEWVKNKVCKVRNKTNIFIKGTRFSQKVFLWAVVARQHLIFLEGVQEKIQWGKCFPRSPLELLLLVGQIDRIGLYIKC